MAARAPAAIGDLTDELLARVFAAVADLDVDEHAPMQERRALPLVCRHWRAVAASPAAAAVWARVEVAHIDDPAADPARFSSLVGWFAVRGAHVRALALRNEDYETEGAWEAARAVVALAPGIEELAIGCYTPPPADLEWWHSLPPGLTRLALHGFGGDSLAAAGAGAPLPPTLLELELGMADRLPPPALAGLARLTRLDASSVGAEAAAASEDFFQVLLGLGALRSLALGCDALQRVPAAVGALSALTHLDVGLSAVSAPGALGPLASLPRLESLRLCADWLRTPSALAGLTSLRELTLHYNTFGHAVWAPIVEPGPYLAGLRVLRIDVVRMGNAPPGFVDVPRRVVEPLRAATALTALAFGAWYSGPTGAASCLLLTSDRVEALLAGKPALRRVRVAQEMRLEEVGAHFAALGRRHPQIEFSLPAPTGRVCDPAYCPRGCLEHGRWYR